jgi:hypothetical protein
MEMLQAGKLAIIEVARLSLIFSGVWIKLAWKFNGIQLSEVSDQPHIM